jgi:four helix bundle protein
MTEIQNSKQYNLEQRTQDFARRVRIFVQKIPRNTSNLEDGKQVIRSSGSIGANYIEANEALSKKDFIMRIKISRKEAKETKFWLSLIDVGGKSELENEKELLIKEASELMMIFSAIMRKSEIRGTKSEAF